MPLADRAAFRRFVPWSVRRATRVVVGAEYTRLDLVDAVPGLALDRVEVIPYGVPPGFAPDDDAAAAARAAHGLEAPYVVFLGDLQPRKNLARLLEAWAIVRARRPEPGDPRAGRRAAARGATSSTTLVARLGLDGPRAPARPRRGHGRPARPALRRLGARLPVALRGLRLPGRRGDGLRHAGRRRRDHGAARDGRRGGDPRRPAGARRRSPTGCCACSTTRRRRAACAGPASPACASCAGTAPPSSSPPSTSTCCASGRRARMPPRPVRRGARGAGDGVRRLHRRGRAAAALHRRPARPGPRRRAAASSWSATAPATAARSSSARPSPTSSSSSSRSSAASPRTTTPGSPPRRRASASILNPDVLVEPGAVRALLDLMEERPACGVAVPLLVYPDGRAAALRAALPGADRHRRAADAPAPHHRPPRRRRPLPAAARRRRGRSTGRSVPACSCAAARGTTSAASTRATRASTSRTSTCSGGCGRRAGRCGRRPAAIARHEHQAATDETFLTRRTLWHLEGMARFARKNPAMLGGLVPALAQRSVDGTP